MLVWTIEVNDYYMTNPKLLQKKKKNCMQILRGIEARLIAN